MNKISDERLDYLKIMCKIDFMKLDASDFTHDISDLLGELQAYLTEESEGRIVRLPCKVGDTVYKLCKAALWKNIGDMSDGKLIKKNCDRCAYRYSGCARINAKTPNAITKLTNLHRDWILAHENEFGTSIFLTKADAEAKLKEIKDGAL